MSASDDGRYSWIPLAQLQNFIKHGVIVTRVESSASFSLQSPPKAIPQGQTTLEDATRDHTLQTLQETKWVGGERKGAAVRLGLARTTFIAKCGGSVSSPRPVKCSWEVRTGRRSGRRLKLDEGCHGFLPLPRLAPL
jgi:hypothetical protein